MSRKAKGYIDRIPIGADPTRYYPGIGKDRYERKFGRALTPEQAAEAQKKRDEAIKRLLRESASKWGVKPEDVDLFVDDPDAYGAMIDQRSAQERALEKIKDRQARDAVEGDTDLNHDNIEPSK